MPSVSDALSRVRDRNPSFKKASKNKAETIVYSVHCILAPLKASPRKEPHRVTGSLCFNSYASYVLTAILTPPNEPNSTYARVHKLPERYMPCIPTISSAHRHIDTAHRFLQPRVL